LTRYDSDRDVFINYTHDENDAGSLSSNFVWSVLVDSNDDLWVATNGGLDKYDMVKKEFIHYRHDPDASNSISHNKATMVIEANDGFLWVSTYGGGLNKLDPEKGTFINYSHNEQDPRSLGNDLIWSLYEDKNGTLWVGTEGGLDKFDPKTETFTHYRHDEKDPGSLSGIPVTSIFRDSREKLWVGTSEHGLNLHEPRTDTFQRFQKDQDDPHSLADDAVWNIYEDVNGTLWIATFNGVDRFDNAGVRFDHYQHYPGNPDSLSTDAVQAFCGDSSGMLWIGTRGGGLNCFDPVKQTFTHYFHDQDNPASSSNNTVLDIVQAPDGAFWIGTGAGLDRFDPQRKLATRYQNNPNDQCTLGRGAVRAMNFAPDGALWIGLHGGGVCRFDPDSGIFTRFMPEKNNPNSLISEWITAILVDASGRIWVGTEAGLSILNPGPGVFTNFLPDVNDPHSLSDNCIHTIYQDEQEAIWIGTNQGLNQFNENSENFTVFTANDGLAGDIVVSVISDNRGFLWIGTNNGLSKFDSQKETFRNYDIRDGLQGNQFKRNAVYKSPDGELFFGGVNGFNSFFPDKITDNSDIPPVFLTDFQLFNQTVGIGGDSPLRRHINVAKQITLTHAQSVFTFKFAALNYQYPQKNQYAYMMKGFDKDFTYIDNTVPHANYSNLDPGEYTFKVKGSNNDGVWNEQGTSLKIKILPPWWETTWFRILFLAGLAGLIGAIYQWRLSTVNAHRRQLELEIKERKQVEAELKKHREHLEELVSNRTAELNSSTEKLVRGIAQRKLSEDALLESEKRFSLAMEASKDGLWDWNIITDETYYSPSYTAMLGYSSGELPAHISSWSDLIHPEDKDNALKGNMDCIENRCTHFKIEFRMQAQNGEWRWIMTRGKAADRDSSGRALRMVGTHTDITEQKQAEEELKNRQKFLDSIIEQSPFPTWISDTEGVMIRVNPALKKALNLSDNQLIGKYNVFQDKQLEPHIIKMVRDALEHGKTSHYELDWIGDKTGIDGVEQGNRVYCEGTMFPIYNHSGDITNAVITYKDVSDKKRAEQAIIKQRNNAQRYLNIAGTMIIVLNRKAELLVINDAGCKISGYERDEIIGKNWIYLGSIPEERDIWVQAYKKIMTGEIELSERHEGSFLANHEIVKTVIWTNSLLKDEDGNTIGMLCSAQDITESKKTEEALRKSEKQLRRSQKMETVGILAGGIAHEFNNLLYIISGNTELLMDDASPADKEMLLEIFNSTQRGANLVKQLMAFSRKSEINLYTMLLNDEMYKIKKMLVRVLPRMIEIKHDFAADLHPIKADHGQIEQVVMNLCLNAKDAMPDGGTLIIKTENGVIDETFVDKHPGKPDGLKQGKCVILTVSDTGVGMDEEAREHAFDPFFTTKEIGKGTGLGLSVIYGIIEGHHAHISCDSEKGVGTTFRIYFPAIEDDQTESIADKDSAEQLSKGAETILVVDDEEAILKMMINMLGRLGYNIFSADNAESALDIYTAKQKEIDLILLDLSMPGMGGKECMKKLIEFDPDVKIIIASGYADQGLIQDNLNSGAKNFVIKPFSKDNISKVIREVLDNSVRSSSSGY